jgi:hypothetical protein
MPIGAHRPFAYHQSMNSADATEDLGMPKFLPALPKRHQDRLEALVEREADKFWRGVERRKIAVPSAEDQRKPRASRPADFRGEC